MKLNTIYSTFNGEVNFKGIGSNCIFLRLQGCHLRCYKKTLGILCDTPEGLKKSTERDEISLIFAGVEKVSKDTGLKLITLTGGDPLWNKESELIELLTLLSDNGYIVNVETSGTLSWLPYIHIKNVHWIIDYKGKSTGVQKTKNLLLDANFIRSLGEKDFIKFVIYDLEDFNDFLDYMTFYEKSGGKTNVSVGAFWGGKLDTLEIFNLLKENKQLAKVSVNMQTHKMAVSSDYNKSIPLEI